LLISAPLDFYCLRRARAGLPTKPDVEINLTVGAMPPRRSITHAWQGRFRLTLEGGAGAGWTIRYRDDVAISCDPGGTILDCVCRDADQIPLLGDILSRRVLPRLVALHGRVPIHAAALAGEDGAILVFGVSGAGKSTLTAAMAAAGWDIMSDDMSILTGVDDPRVWQSAPGVSVWEQSRYGLALPDAACRPINGYGGKYWYAPPHREHAEPAPVRAMIFLSFGAPDETIEWHRLTGPGVVVRAASQMVRFDPTDNNEIAIALDALSRLVRHVPCYALAYPRAYDALPRTIEAVAAIQQDARQHEPL
jgi:hypothetical protein